MRLLPYPATIGLTAAVALLAVGNVIFLWLLVPLAVVTAIGTRDLLQRRHRR